MWSKVQKYKALLTQILSYEEPRRFEKSGMGVVLCLRRSGNSFWAGLRRARTALWAEGRMPVMSRAPKGQRRWPKANLEGEAVHTCVLLRCG